MSQESILSPWLQNLSYFKYLGPIYLFIFSFLFGHSACEILVPWPGITPVPLAVEAWSLNHWITREVPQVYWINKWMDGVPFLCTKSPSETGLGPGTLCCNACTWTHLSWSNKTQRNYMGLKITVHEQSGQILDKRYKETKNPTAQSPEQKQGIVHAPCTQHHLKEGQNI